MPLRATERDVYEFFSKAGKVGKVVNSSFLGSQSFLFQLDFNCIYSYFCIMQSQVWYSVLLSSTIPPLITSII